MRKMNLRKNCCLALGITLMLAFALPAQADKPSWAGKEGKSSKHQKKEQYDNNQGSTHVYSGTETRSDVDIHVHFGDHQRDVIRHYYADQYRSGHCPPGLAKKHNGCMPPGQVKKWRIGRPLPREVIYYDLPPAVIVQLGPPPHGHRYVRVASDILLIAVGTGMIVDAIADLSGM